MTSVSTFAAPVYKSVTALVNETLRIELNGIGKKLDNPAITYNSTTYISLRDIAILIGAEIKYDPASKTVKIKTVEGTSAETTNGSVIKSPREIINILSKKYPDKKIIMDEDGVLRLNGVTYQLQLIDEDTKLFSVQILIDNGILLQSDI